MLLPNPWREPLVAFYNIHGRSWRSPTLRPRPPRINKNITQFYNLFACLIWHIKYLHTFKVKIGHSKLGNYSKNLIYGPRAVIKFENRKRLQKMLQWNTTSITNSYFFLKMEQPQSGCEKKHDLKSNFFVCNKLNSI